MRRSNFRLTTSGKTLLGKLCCHLFLCSFQEKLSRLLERHSKLILGCWLCFAMSFVKMFPHCFNNIEVWTNPWLIVLHFLFLFFWPFTALVHSFAFLVMLKREAVANQMLSGCYHMVDPNLSIHFCVHSSLLTRAQPLKPWQSLHCVGLLTPSVRLKSDLKLKKIMFQFSKTFCHLFSVQFLGNFAYHFCLPLLLLSFSYLVSLNCFVMFCFGVFKEHTVHCGEVCR